MSPSLEEVIPVLRGRLCCGLERSSQGTPGLLQPLQEQKRGQKGQDTLQGIPRRPWNPVGFPWTRQALWRSRPCRCQECSQDQVPSLGRSTRRGILCGKGQRKGGTRLLKRPKSELFFLQQYEEWKENLPDTEWIRGLMPEIELDKFRSGILKTAEEIK